MSPESVCEPHGLLLSLQPGHPLDPRGRCWEGGRQNQSSFQSCVRVKKKTGMVGSTSLVLQSILGAVLRCPKTL